MEITFLNISEIKPYLNNPRNNEKSIDKVAKSIEAFGWKQPIVVDKDKFIIAGHTRYLAAKKIGCEKVPVIIASDLSSEKVKAYRLADNRVSQCSTWNNELLKLEIAALKEFDIDISLTGFDASEIDFLFKEPVFDKIQQNENDRLDQKKKAHCPNCDFVFDL